jgi:thiol-disulfide isomerase/thioredoxin
MRSIIFLLILFLHHFNLLAQPATIEGRIDNYTGPDTLSLVAFANDSSLAVAPIARDGTFSLQADIRKGNVYKLRLASGHYLMLIVKPGDQMRIELDATDMYHPVIEGSPESEVIYQVPDILDRYDKQLEAYTQKLEREKADELAAIAQANKHSLSVLFFIENIPYEEYPGLHREISQNLYAQYPDNPVVKELKERTDTKTRLAAGSPAPPLDVNDTSGAAITIAQFEGKLLLIDFWTSKCTPCRHDHLKLAKLYEQYHDRGFEILSVALEMNKQPWQKAIQRGQLGWPQGSDLKYRDTPLIDRYQIQGLPHRVLVNPEGNIITINPPLEKLESLIKEKL